MYYFQRDTGQIWGAWCVAKIPGTRGESDARAGEFGRVQENEASSTPDITAGVQE